MKKLWSILLVFCILFSCFSPSAAFASQNKQENDKVEKLVKKGIIQGDEKGDLKLNEVITRSELIKIVVYSLGLEDLAKNLQSQKGKFPDVGTDHWANGVINVASTVKMPNGQYLINGFPDGQFKPENKITYQEFIKVLVVASKFDLQSNQMKDAKWPDSYFNWAKELKIIGEGTGVENLTPSADAIRNIVFNALYNALDKMEETKSKLKEESLRKAKENLRKGIRDDKETTHKHTTSGSSNAWFGWWGSSSGSSSSSGGSSSSGSTPSKPVTPAKPVTPSKPVTPAKEFTVSFNVNGGSGNMASVKVEKGKEYTLPANTFKPADGKEFKAWEVEGAEKQVGDKISINKDIEVKALWKEKEDSPLTPAKKFTISFNSNGGSGSMASVVVEKDKSYTLPGNKFTAPQNKVFKAWEVEGAEKQVGDKISINKDIEVKALWKEKGTPTPKPTGKAYIIETDFSNGFFQVKVNDNDDEEGDEEVIKARAGEKVNITFNAPKSAKKVFDRFVVLEGNVKIENADQKNGAYFTMPERNVKIGVEVRDKTSTPSPKPNPTPNPKPSPKPGGDVVVTDAKVSLRLIERSKDEKGTLKFDNSGEQNSQYFGFKTGQKYGELGNGDNGKSMLETIENLAKKNGFKYFYIEKDNPAGESFKTKIGGLEDLKELVVTPEHFHGSFITKDTVYIYAYVNIYDDAELPVGKEVPDTPKPLPKPEPKPDTPSEEGLNPGNPNMAEDPKLPTEFDKTVTVYVTGLYGESKEMKVGQKFGSDKDVKNAIQNPKVPEGQEVKAWKVKRTGQEFTIEQILETQIKRNMIAYNEDEEGFIIELELVTQLKGGKDTKAVLKSEVEKAKAIDLSKYTQESAQRLEDTIKRTEDLLEKENIKTDAVTAELFNLKEFTRGLVDKDDNFTVKGLSSSSGASQIHVLFGTDDYIEKWKNAKFDRFDSEKTNREYGDTKTDTYMPFHYRELNFANGTEIQVQKNSDIYIKVQTKYDVEPLKMIEVNGQKIDFKINEKDLTAIETEAIKIKVDKDITIKTYYGKENKLGNEDNPLKAPFIVTVGYLEWASAERDKSVDKRRDGGWDLDSSQEATIIEGQNFETNDKVLSVLERYAARDDFRYFYIEKWKNGEKVDFGYEQRFTLEELKKEKLDGRMQCVKCAGSLVNIVGVFNYNDSLKDLINIAKKLKGNEELNSAIEAAENEIKSESKTKESVKNKYDTLKKVVLKADPNALDKKKNVEKEIEDEDIGKKVALYLYEYIDGSEYGNLVTEDSNFNIGKTYGEAAEEFLDKLKELSGKPTFEYFYIYKDEHEGDISDLSLKDIKELKSTVEHEFGGSYPDQIYIYARQNPEKKKLKNYSIEKLTLKEEKNL